MIQDRPRASSPAAYVHEARALTAQASPLLGVPLVLQLNIVSAIGRGATVELRAAGTAPWAVRRRWGKGPLPCSE